MARLATFVALAALSLLASSAQPQVPDHLKCYKVKDPQAKISYVATLTGLTLETGCVIQVPAKQLCVPAIKSNVSPTPPGGGGSGIPNTFLCYKVKCPQGALPQLTAKDQFGSRTVTPTKAQLVCAPAAPVPTTTTTTTTLPPCSLSAAPACNGDCAGGICVYWPDFNICTCV